MINKKNSKEKFSFRLIVLMSVLVSLSTTLVFNLLTFGVPGYNFSQAAMSVPPSSVGGGMPTINTSVKPSPPKSGGCIFLSFKECITYPECIWMRATRCSRWDGGDHFCSSFDTARDCFEHYCRWDLAQGPSCVSPDCSRVENLAGCPVDACTLEQYGYCDNR